MTKSCRCFWADEDGTCSLGEDPPIQETCPYYTERINVMTGEPWPENEEDWPEKQPPEETWRNKV